MEIVVNEAILTQTRDHLFHGQTRICILTSEKSKINKSGEFEQIILFYSSVYISKDIFYQNVNRDG